MTDTIKPEVGKTYLTRDGRKARCICTDMRDGEYPVVCLVEFEGSETTETYTAGGYFDYDRSVDGCDLVSEAPRVVTVNVWAEITPDGRVVYAFPWEVENNDTGNTVVKITQDVLLPAAPEVK